MNLMLRLVREMKKLFFLDQIMFVFFAWPFSLAHIIMGRVLLVGGLRNNTGP